MQTTCYSQTTLLQPDFLFLIEMLTISLSLSLSISSTIISLYFFLIEYPTLFRSRNEYLEENASRTFFVRCNSKRNFTWRFSNLVEILFHVDSMATSVLRAVRVVPVAKFYTGPGGNVRQLTTLCWRASCHHYSQLPKFINSSFVLCSTPPALLSIVSFLPHAIVDHFNLSILYITMVYLVLLISLLIIDL